MPQLLWKEWHEQSWKLGFGCIVLGTLALLAFRARLLADQTTAMWICYIGITLLPILSSTGLIPAERGDGTLEMLLALPVPRWRLLAVKLISSIMLVAGPMLLAMIASIALAGGREIGSSSMVTIYLRSIATAIMLMLWMFAATARLPTEARAALIAVGVLIIWELLTAFLGEFGSYAWQHKPVSWLPSLSPIAFVFGMNDSDFIWTPLWVIFTVQLLTAVGLWICCVKQLSVSDAAE